MTEYLGTKFSQPLKADPKAAMLGASLRLVVADSREGLTEAVANDAELILSLKTAAVRGYVQRQFGAKKRSPRDNNMAVQAIKIPGFNSTK
jgi:hypothetical protein